MGFCRDAAVGMLLTNACAVFTSFNAAPLLDCTAWPRLAQMSNSPMWKFHLGNFLVHVLPVFVALFWWLSLQGPTPMGPFTGFATAAVHFTWSFLRAGGLDLSEVYVEMQLWQWYVLWIIAATTHLLVGVVMFSMAQTTVL